MRYRHSGETAPEPGWTWRRSSVIGIGAAAIIATAVGVYFLSQIGAPEEEEPIIDKHATLWEAPPVSYEPPAPVITPAAIIQPMAIQPANSVETEQPPKPLNEAIAAARSGGFGKYEPSGTSLADISASGGGCRLPAGTKIHAEMETATTSTNASVVTARVSYDVLGEGGCQGIMAGAMFVGNSQQGADFGAERSSFTFHTIEQDGKPSVSIEAAAADAMGMGGVPGEVDHHTSMIAWRVGIATATGILDSAASSLVSFGGIPVRESSRAIDKWADQAIDLDPTLETDPSQRRVPVLITLPKAIVL